MGGESLAHKVPNRYHPLQDSGLALPGKEKFLVEERWVLSTCWTYSAVRPVTQFLTHHGLVAERTSWQPLWHVSPY